MGASAFELTAYIFIGLMVAYAIYDIFFTKGDDDK